MTNGKSLEQDANAILKKYVLAACATGAVPVPAVSAAIIAENSLMINQIASLYGCEISLSNITASIGLMGSVNLVGRTVYIEAARALSWGGIFFGAPILISALGAATAGLQTYLIGLVAIESAKRGGKILPSNVVKGIFQKGKDDFDAFRKSA